MVYAPTLLPQDCAANGVKGRLGVVLRAYLEAYLPQDAHTLCDGVTFLAVTKGASTWPGASSTVSLTQTVTARPTVQVY